MGASSLRGPRPDIRPCPGQRPRLGPRPRVPGRGRPARLALLSALAFAASGAPTIGADANNANHSAAVGPRLSEHLLQPIPGEGLRVLVSLERSDLPGPGRGIARRAAINARQQRVIDSLPTGRSRVTRRYRSLSGFAMQADAAALDALMRHPETVLVYLDGRVRATLAQSNALIGADTVHSSGYTGAGIKVAVLDSGIDTDHPDLVGDIAAEHCFCSGSGGCCVGGASEASTAEDGDGHGTSVAGIVTSAGVAASVGVAPDAKIVAVKVLDGGEGSFSDVAAALDWVLTESAVPAGPVEGLRVVNLSLGDDIEHNDPDVLPCSGSLTANAIQLLEQAGIAVVVSSGNDGFDDGIAFPACVSEAISVGGVYDAVMGTVQWCGETCATILCTDPAPLPDQFVCHSNSDEILDVLAPDWRIRTSALGGGVVNFGGTSAASPFIAGEAALLFEAQASLTPADVRTLLKTHGPLVSNPDNGLSWVRSDVAAAVAAATAPVCGNSIVESGESCDDGNTQDGDCCSASCSLDPEGSSCDDGRACTGSETCSAGVCSGVDLCTGGFSCDETLDLCIGGTPAFEEYTALGLGSSATSLTLMTPAGATEGDLLIAVITTDGSHADTLAPPGGEAWAELELDAGGGTPTLGVWWKLAGASESATHQWTWSGGERGHGAILRFTEHDATAPIETSAAGGGGNSFFPTAPGVTTMFPGTLILRIGGFDDDDVTVGDAGMAGHTTILMDVSSSGSGTCSSGVASAIVGPGAVGSADFALTDDEQWRTVTLALPPAVAPAACGNAILEGSESCDAGAANGTTACGCATDCSFPELAEVCDDSVSCTEGEACDGLGSCLGGVPNDALCDDQDPCTADSCDAISGCQSTPIEQCGASVPAASSPLRLVVVLLLLAAGAVFLATEQVRCATIQRDEEHPHAADRQPR